MADDTDRVTGLEAHALIMEAGYTALRETPPEGLETLWDRYRTFSPADLLMVMERLVRSIEFYNKERDRITDWVTDLEWVKPEEIEGEKKRAAELFLERRRDDGRLYAMEGIYNYYLNKGTPPEWKDLPKEERKKRVKLQGKPHSYAIGFVAVYEAKKGQFKKVSELEAAASIKYKNDKSWSDNAMAMVRRELPRGTWKRGDVHSLVEQMRKML